MLLRDKGVEKKFHVAKLKSQDNINRDSFHSVLYN